MTLLTADRISLRYHERYVLNELSFALTETDRVGLVGKNGCGKTSLFEILVGHIEPTFGSVFRANTCTLEYAEQELNRVGDWSLFDFVASARSDLLEAREKLAQVQERLTASPGDFDLLEQLGALQVKFETEGGFSFENEITAILEGLGFLRERHRDRLVDFSGGEKNRAGLARVLAGRANLLLLDEPTNHLDIESTCWLEEYLKASGKAYVVVSHDRAFLQAVVDKVWELVDGRLAFYTGGLERYLSEREARRRQHAHAYRHQQEEIKRLEEFVRRNMAGQKTRQAQSKLKYLSRIKRLPPPREETRAAAIRVTSSGRSFAHVLAVAGATVAYDGEPVLREVSFDLYRGDHVGLIGRNGSGKTTLLKALVGELTPVEGEILLGNNVDVAYFDQELSNLDLQQTVLDSIWELDTTAEMGAIRSFLARFGFSGDDSLQMVSSLSGGEKTKLSLARLLYHPSNFIIFDEPTNHLDMDSREALEEALIQYDGSCLVVSHDRHFLNRVANRILHVDNGSIRTYDGNYQYFRDKTTSNAPPVEPKPTKSKDDFLAFKELSRQRGRLKKALKDTREQIGQTEAALERLGQDLAGNIPGSDWEALQAAIQRQRDLEESLLRLYSLLEELERTDLG